MTTIAAPICTGCKHYRRPTDAKPGLRCDVFQRGIPDAIIESRSDHRKPYAGDGGKRFIPTDDAAAKYADLLFRETAK